MKGLREVDRPDRTTKHAPSNDKINIEMATREEIRAQVRKNLISLSKRELMDATKDAVKELMHENIALFGWWSLKTLGTALLGAAIMFIIYLKMGYKP